MLVMLEKNPQDPDLQRTWTSPDGITMEYNVDSHPDLRQYVSVVNRDVHRQPRFCDPTLQADLEF